MSMRTEGLLFLALVAQPAEQVADVGIRRAVLLWRDVLDHLPMRRRSVRRRSRGEVVLLGEELDARGLAVDIDPIADVETETGARFTGSRLSELACHFREIDRQAFHVNRGLLRRRPVRGAENHQPDK